MTFLMSRCQQSCIFLVTILAEGDETESRLRATPKSSVSLFFSVSDLVRRSTEWKGLVSGNLDCTWRYAHHKLKVALHFYSPSEELDYVAVDQINNGESLGIEASNDSTKPNPNEETINTALMK